MMSRTEAISQRWRILNEYEDEDTEFRPAFAFGSHKMDTDRSWHKTKRKCKPFLENASPSGSELQFRIIDIKDIEWKRPEEIARIVSETNETPKFVASGISRFDINQGTIGDCWAVSVIANLASTVKARPEILDQVFDAKQSFDEGNHQFTFKFFKNGDWTEVTVDDYLPWNTERQKLLFVSSTDKLEFWPCLLEKAYAKFKGSYADLVGGFEYVGLTDMTGIEWKETDTTEDLYHDICDKLTSNGLVLAACLGSNWRHNLVPGHAYSVTGFGGDVNQGKCLRVRNPWGTGDGEYTGDEAHVLNAKLDGEFVIKWEEFVKYFPILTMNN